MVPFLSVVHDRLYAWYQANGRHDLPWRQTDDAYRIYLSEIMLQQTQVKTVLERFYFPFLKRFETLQSVAEAPLDDVLKAWEGLGYYTRAKNLHHTALTCQGVLPKTPEELGGLKGIGKSTAHAICAFAYRQALPILDANVKRVLCRYFALHVKDENVLWQKAWELLDTKRPFEYNQAMMDLGSMVCTSKNPTCNACPMKLTCQGKTNPENYPQSVKKPKIPIKKRFASVVIQEGKLGLIQRKERLLHGLWGFVQTDEKPEGRFLGVVRHTYSHFKLELEVFQPQYCGKALDGWFDEEAIASLALSTVDKKILRCWRSMMMKSIISNTD
ncbi:A/G-specific adenine glycosylase [Sulfurospirillum cavolei]|uniref:A/G-specific adenine glycosylase n=1 Tax=Sulfurospirillum cavolei TaxID=366522 RepID=UPI0005A94F64|nr:A/G-specific adenine glycosylase [Sulfurospirillum cavolei]